MLFIVSACVALSSYLCRDWKLIIAGALGIFFVEISDLGFGGSSSFFAYVIGLCIIAGPSYFLLAGAWALYIKKRPTELEVLEEELRSLNEEYDDLPKKKTRLMMQMVDVNNKISSLKENLK